MDEKRTLQGKSSNTRLTRIIEAESSSDSGVSAPDLLSNHPYCSLPEFFFDRALSSSQLASRRRTLLAIEGADGHDILRVEGD